MKKFALLLTLVLLFAIASCTPQETPEPTLEPTPPPQETPEPTPKPPYTNPVNVDYITDELPESFAEFTDNPESAEYDTHRVIFTSNAPVSNFDLLDIGFEIDDEGEFVFYGTSLSGAFAGLDMPLVVHGMAFSAIPSRGVSFIDENGISRQFLLQMSGEDGSLFLTEF